MEAFAGICIVVAIALALWLAPHPIHVQSSSVHATDGDPVIAVPAVTRDIPVATTAELKLTLTPPDTDIVAKYQREALLIPNFPLAGGVDEKPIGMSPNELVLFAALIGSESSWNPYENGNLKVSSAGCVGIAQICNLGICGGITDDDRRNDERALYYGACYLHSLIVQYGDFATAIAAYKGALVNGVIVNMGVVNSVWNYIRITT